MQRLRAHRNSSDGFITSSTPIVTFLRTSGATLYDDALASDEREALAADLSFVLRVANAQVLQVRQIKRLQHTAIASLSSSSSTPEAAPHLSTRRTFSACGISAGRRSSALNMIASRIVLVASCESTCSQ